MTLRAVPVIALALLTGGCLWPTSAPTTQPGWAVGDGHGSPTDPAASTQGQDAKPAAPFGVRVDVWALGIPKGAVSTNEAFWKRVDENAIDPIRNQLLFSNGFRVGVARDDSWEYYRDLLARYPTKVSLNAVSTFEEQTIEVPVKTAVESETLSYFAPSQPVHLRSYDHCDNILCFTFQPAPRRTDAARIALTPMVRASASKREVTEKDGDFEVKWVKPERLYDLNLALEVPFGQFLVVSPSADADNVTSIGRNFMLFDGDSEQREMVLLIVPSRVELKEAPKQGTRLGDPTSAEKK